MISVEAVVCLAVSIIYPSLIDRNVERVGGQEKQVVFWMGIISSIAL